MDPKVKANLFFGYMLYAKKKGAEAVRAGLNPNKVVKMKTYLVEELNYTEQEAKDILKYLREDSIDRKNEKRKD